MSARIYTAPLAALSILFITACGGGGSGGSGDTDTGNNTGGSSGGSQKNEYLVSTNVGDGVTISPTSRTITEGETTTFEVTPDVGFEIFNVYGCNGTFADGVYTTGAINAACTVTATANNATFTVTATIAQGGSVTPAEVEVEYNRDAEFLVELEPYYSITSVTGCNYDSLPAPGESSYTLTVSSVTENCDLVITAELPGPDVFYDVTVDIFGEGTVSPESARGNFSDVFEFTLTPADGYVLANTEGCEGSLTGNVYTTGPLVESCTIQVDFVEEGAVYIADENLRAIVETELGLEPGTTVTTEMMAALTSLTLTNSEIVSLAGLEHAVNLTTLRAGYNPISDISPISSLPIEVLNLDYTEITNILELANMPIRELRIHGTSVDSIEVLKNIESLRGLDISNTNVLNLDALSDNSSLSWLNFYATDIRDIRPLVDANVSNAFVAGYGCVSPSHYATRQAIGVLNERGVTVEIPSTNLRDSCRLNRPTISATVEQELTNSEFALSWSVDSDLNPNYMTCAIHFDLQSQTPRVPDHFIEQCAFNSSVTLAANQSGYQVSVIFSDGLDATYRVDLNELRKANITEGLFYRSSDWGQAAIKSAPYLVPNRSALYRVHISAPATTEVLEGELRVTVNGTTTTLPMTPPESYLVNKVHTSLRHAYHTSIPAALMQEGLEVQFYLDGELVHTETPEFTAQIPLYLTVVPMVVNGVEPNILSDEVLKETLHEHWPLSQIEIRRREAYTVLNPEEVEEAADLLYQLRDLRFEDGEGYGSHYHGFFNYDEVGGDASGVAFLTGTEGVSWDRINRSMSTFSHEMGHNFSVSHIDCGSPEGIEEDFPYDPSTIGSVGVTLANDTLIQPTDAVDIMSYCDPEHVSDWVFEKAQDFMLAYPSQPFGGTNITTFAPAENSRKVDTVKAVRISGVINATGEVEIRSIQEAMRPGSLAGNSELAIQATTQSGMKFTNPMFIPELSTPHSRGLRYFEGFVELPLDEIHSIQVVNPYHAVALYNEEVSTLKLKRH